MNDDTPERSSIRVDVGVKASLELKAEIPKETSGRILDALTDAIRPFTEKRGLKADIIRLQREDVALEIAKRALKRKEIEGLTFKSVPNKILVPILERGSLEEPESALIDWWSNLLTSSATKGAIRPFLIDLMSALGDQEAKFLHSLWTDYSAQLRNAGTFLGEPEHIMNYVVSTVKPKLDEHLSKIFATGQNSSIDFGKMASVLGRTMFELAAWGDGVGVPFELSAPVAINRNGALAIIGQKSSRIEQAGSAVDVCKALNILREYTHFEPVPGLIGAQARYDVRALIFTRLGVEFMKACMPAAQSTAQQWMGVPG